MVAFVNATKFFIGFPCGLCETWWFPCGLWIVDCVIPIIFLSLYIGSQISKVGVVFILHISHTVDGSEIRRSAPGMSNPFSPLFGCKNPP